MSGAPNTPAVRDDALQRAPRETQWEIVWRMFRRRNSAVWGLRGTIALVLLALFCPVLCAGLPLWWQEPDGAGYSPWLLSLLDRNYWQSGVDRAFNLAMILTVVWALGWLVLGGVGRLAKWARPEVARLRGGLRKGMVWLGAVLVLLQVLGFSWLSTSAPYKDFPQRHREMVEAGVEHTAVFTLIPYGHREQRKTKEDRYRGPMSFEQGERHLLGTDRVGRDVLARLLYGTRISLTVGLVAVSIYVLIGIIVGSIAGYAGGRWDLFIMRIVEIVMCIPAFFLLLTIIAFVETRSIMLIMVAIGVVGWTGIARLIRGEIIRERGLDYVQAAKSLGLSHARILFRHVLPNSVGPIIVASSFGIAGAILTESMISFLGLGDTNVPSWGMILNDGRIDTEWHMIMAPGVAIFITVTLLNLVGDGLRDALDPKLRK